MSKSLKKALFVALFVAALVLLLIPLLTMPATAVAPKCQNLQGHYYTNASGNVEIDLTKTYTLRELRAIFGYDLSDLTTFGNVFTDCATAGKVAFTCSGCGVEFLFDATGDHIYLMNKDATDFATGKLVFVCANDAAHKLELNTTWYEIVDTPATCLAGGSKVVNYTYKDPNSGLTVSDSVTLEIYSRSHLHTFGATTTIDLNKNYTISELKAIFGDTLTGLNFFGNFPTTCQADVPASFVCDVCSQDLLILHIRGDHDWTDWTEVPAECGVDGYKYRTCKTTGCTEREKEKIDDALEHIFNYALTEPTADATGKLVVTCDRGCDCNKEYAIPAKGDAAYTWTTDVEANCQREGKKTAKYVVKEGETVVYTYTYTVVTSWKHHYAAFVLYAKNTYRMSELKEIFGEGLSGLSFSALPADCAKEVSASFKCEDCDGNVSISISADHICNLENAVSRYFCTSATCTAAATYYKSCACGAEKSGETFSYGNPLPHTYNQKVAEERYFVSAATCTTPETYCWSCVCGEKGNVTFTVGYPLPHTYDQEKPEDRYLRSRATCTAPACYYKSCACGARDYSSSFVYGDPLPHTYDRQVAQEQYFCASSNCTAAATYYKSCACGLAGSETFSYGDTLPHTFDCLIAAEKYLKSPATTADSAVYYKSCVCGEKGTATFSYGEPLPDPGELHTHSFDRSLAAEVYLATPASCTAAATYYKSCVCGVRGSDTFLYGTATTHQFDQELADEEYLANPATCTAAAAYYKSCTCGEKGTDTFFFGDALEHSFGRELATEQYLATPASCTAGATYYKSCTCGEKGSETFVYGEPTHVFECLIAAERYLKTPATTTDCAVYYKSCTCGEKGTTTFSYGSPLPETPPTDDTPTTGGCGGALDGTWVILLGLALAVTVKARKRKEN